MQCVAISFRVCFWFVGALLAVGRCWRFLNTACTLRLLEVWPGRGVGDCGLSSDTAGGCGDACPLNHQTCAPLAEKNVCVCVCVCVSS